MRRPSAGHAIVLALLIALTIQNAAGADGPPRGLPMGPYKRSTAPRREGGPERAQPLEAGERPLVERCKEEWRETRLDHFRCFGGWTRAAAGGRWR